MNSNLTKIQKVQIILSVIWTIISLLIAGGISNDSYSGFSLVAFLTILLAVSMPVWIYWAGVWIWGFGYLLKGIKFLISRLRSLLVKLLIAVLILGEIAFIIMMTGLLAGVNIPSYQLGLLIVPMVFSCLFTPVWIYLDATKRKIGQTGKRSFSNKPAGEIAALSFLMWFIAVPYWFWRRKKLIEKAKINPVEVSKKRKVLSVTLLLLVPILYGIFNILRDETKNNNAAQIANERVIQALEIINQDPALEICNKKVQSGAIKTNVEYAVCKNPIIINAFKKAGARHIDLLNLVAQKNLKNAERMDMEEITDEQQKGINNEFGLFLLDVLKRDVLKP